MRVRRRDDDTRSLAEVVRGEILEIGHILFDGVRALCDDLGLRRGDRVRCRDVTPTRLLLETEAGRLLQLDRRWALFVEARAAEPRRAGA